VQNWVVEVGVIASVCLVFWLMLRRRGSRRAQVSSPWPGSLRNFFAAVLVVALGCYAAAGAARLPSLYRAATHYFKDQPVDPITSSLKPETEQLLLLIAGACAIMAVLLPIVVDMVRLRVRRVWALARLSFKEAVRSRVLWGFCAILIVFLFLSWFISYDDLKPQDQVRNY